MELWSIRWREWRIRDIGIKKEEKMISMHFLGLQLLKNSFKGSCQQRCSEAARQPDYSRNESHVKINVKHLMNKIW